MVSCRVDPEPPRRIQILEFARSLYGVEFPMFAKTLVNGDAAAGVYKFLKAGNPDEGGREEIAWNFTKFLLGRDGSVLARFGPATTPEAIEQRLGQYL